jgi:hypothetical protein
MCEDFRLHHSALSIGARLSLRLNVKTEVHHVTVLHDVGFAF